ncbi:hypothetical protein [Bacteroides sp. 519]|uniref:hypothetical protein n=1 Tax=Bacteroides sp. 519 TaxID=2302937 RepID=UPI0013D6206F|nr:hypothetical protein [Bacteroides sp. 519]NDV59585.1 hypothetical protein [Bacteroides sp. 519]
MKKLFALLFVVIATTTLVSCEGEQGPQGPPGVTILSEEFTIRKSDWKVIDDNFYYYQRTPSFYDNLYPEELMDIFDCGFMLIYRYLDEDGFVSQQPLPYMDNWNNSNGGTEIDNLWFDYTTGDFRIYYRYSGSGNPELPTGKFRVVVNW